MFKIKSLFKYQTPVYSFIKKVKILTVIIGILTVVSCSPKKEISESKAVSPPKKETFESKAISPSNSISSDSLTNPFTFADLNEAYEYRYRQPMCGTVMSSRPLWLSAEEVHTIIHKVFEEEGIDLQKDYFYEKDSVRVALDGYDPKLNVGYIWTKPFTVQYYDRALLNQLSKTPLVDICEHRIERFEKKDILKKILRDIVNLKDENERRHQYNNFGIFLTIRSDELREAKQKILANPDKATIANQIQEFGFNFLDPKLSLREARHLENTHKSQGDFIAIIDTKDKRFSYQSAYLDHRKYREIKEEKGNEGVRKAQKEEENREKEDHAKALKAFEAHVLQYIQWAKQQAKN